MTRQQRLEQLVAECWRHAYDSIYPPNLTAGQVREHRRRRREEFESKQRALASYVMINVDRITIKSGK